MTQERLRWCVAEAPRGDEQVRSPSKIADPVAGVLPDGGVRRPITGAGRSHTGPPAGWKNSVTET
jgi:hypothetical protein